MQLQTKVQRDIVPSVKEDDPDLADALSSLENEARRIYENYYGVTMPESQPTKATLREFLIYLLDLGRSRRSYEKISRK